MTVLIVFLALICTFFFLVVGVDVQYDGGISLIVRLGPFAIIKYPAEAYKKAKVKIPKTSQKKERDDKRSMDKAFILDLIPIGLKSLGRFKRKLCFDLLVFHFTAGSSDPYNTITQYSRLSALLSGLMPVLENTLNIREQDIRTDFDFNAEKPQIFAHVITTLAIWEGFYIGICLGFSALSAYIRLRKRQRQENILQNAELSEAELSEN